MFVYGSHKKKPVVWRAVISFRILFFGKPNLPGELEAPENCHPLTCTLPNCLAMNETGCKILDTDCEERTHGREWNNVSK